MARQVRESVSSPQIGIVATIATVVIAPLAGPFALLLFPVFYWAARQDAIDSSHDNSPPDVALQVANTWELSRHPGENAISITTKTHTDAMISLPVLRTVWYVPDDNDR